MVGYIHEAKEPPVRQGPRPGYPKPAPEYGAMMANYLAGRGFSLALAKGNGWYPAFMRGVPRIVIPCSNTTGVVYWQARAMTEHPKRYDSPAASRDDSVVVVWPPLILAEIKSIVIAEGPFDALRAAECGQVGIALMGNRPSTSVMYHVVGLVNACAVPALVVPDADSPEMAAALLADLVKQTKRRVKMVMLPAGKKDLAECPTDEAKKILSQALRKR